MKDNYIMRMLRLEQEHIRSHNFFILSGVFPFLQVKGGRKVRNTGRVCTYGGGVSLEGLGVAFPGPGAGSPSSG